MGDIIYLSMKYQLLRNNKLKDLLDILVLWISRSICRLIYSLSDIQFNTKQKFPAQSWELLNSGYRD